MGAVGAAAQTSFPALASRVGAAVISASLRRPAFLAAMAAPSFIRARHLRVLAKAPRESQRAHR
jgi:hypothetical protein